MSEILMKRSLITVASMTLLWAAETCTADTQIYFEGRYEYRTDAESRGVLGEQVCFFPSRPSSGNVPRPAGDRRLAWFCFVDSRQAAQLLGLAQNAPSDKCGFKGDAIIRVSHYTLYTGEGDGNDVAILDAVLEKSKPEPLPCK